MAATADPSLSRMSQHLLEKLTRLRSTLTMLRKCARHERRLLEGYS